MKRRRTVPADKARATIMGGFYSTFQPTRTRYHKCSECGKESVTVKAPGELCAVCEVRQRAEAREGSTGQAGPF